MTITPEHLTTMTDEALTALLRGLLAVGTDKPVECALAATVPVEGVHDALVMVMKETGDRRRAKAWGDHAAETIKLQHILKRPRNG